jgi:hypothetical protein
MWDRPTTFVEGERPFRTVVIVELKKPERKEYSDDENPIEQVFGYVKRLTSEALRDPDGRTVRLEDGARFYGYIVASLTPKMVAFAEGRDMTLMLGGGGWFLYHDRYKVYLELIGYEKLIDDAQRRNLVLFRKLGLVP